MDWATFFELMKQVIDIEGDWRTKANLLIQKAKEHKESATLEEFLDWFGGDATEEL